VVPFAAQACPVLSGIGAEAISGKPRAVETLARQLNETIRWSDCMDAAAEAGMTVALELGPGAALSRMLRSRHPQIACRSVADFRSIDGIATWLARHFD
jgi:[acyl-carrier-protein] S-malonyltransferase